MNTEKISKRFLVLSIVLVFFIIPFAAADEQTVNALEKTVAFATSRASIIKYRGFTPGGKEIDLFVFSLDEEEYYAFILNCDQDLRMHGEDRLYSIDNRGSIIIIERDNSAGFYDIRTGFFSDLLYDSVIPLSNDIAAVVLGEETYFINVHNGLIVYQLSREEHLTDSSFFRGGYSCITNISQSITTIIDTEGRTVSEIRDVSCGW